ncbi:DUF4214 domain-containing protein [Candidatus Woesebacteria bacterium]|nr:DUF4214 domain-containing protein [Candidatus Woesebacteria bacterium]
MNIPFVLRSKKYIVFALFSVVLLTGLGVGLYIINVAGTSTKSDASTADIAALTGFISNIDQAATVNTQPYGSSEKNISNVVAKPLGCCGDNALELTYPSVTDVENRIEISFPQKIDDVLGLGTLDPEESPNTPLLPNNFQDNEFGMGHMKAGNDPKDSEIYQSDRGRMKTPIIVIPSRKLLIAYLYNDLTQIRFQRTDNQTTLVLKKQTALNDTTRKAKVLLITGATIEDVYSNYYKALKAEGYFFKKPNYSVFGPYIETYQSFGCAASREGYTNLISNFIRNGINPTLITIGSGYWQGEQWGCGKSDTMPPVGPTTDAFQVDQTGRWGGKEGLQQFIDYVHNVVQAKVLIGMRFHTWFISAPPKYRDTVQSVLLSYANQYPNLNAGNLWLNNGQIFVGENYNVMSGPQLNYNNPDAIRAWRQAVIDKYGPVDGYKEDEMILMNQGWDAIGGWLVGTNRGDNAKFPMAHGTTFAQVHGQMPTEGRVNMLSDLIPKVYRVVAEETGGGDVIIGRNDSFGVGTDAQNTAGYLPELPWMREYQSKYFLQSMFTQIASGYPTPVMEYMAYPCMPKEIKPISDAEWLKGSHSTPKSLGGASPEKQTYRIHQLLTFLPVAQYSCDYNTYFTPSAQNDEYKKAMNFFGTLRNRLHDYAYDQALTWFETGVPTLMKPFLLDSEYSSLPESTAMMMPCGFSDPGPAIQYSQYMPKACTTDKVPTYQYMFGNALMVRPVLSAVDTVAIYFPPGKWRSFITVKPVIDGGKTIMYQLNGPLDYPVFLKEAEILVIGDTTNTKDLSVYGFLETEGKTESAVYRHAVVGTEEVMRLQMKKEGDATYLYELASGKRALMAPDTYGKGFMIAKLSALQAPVSEPEQIQSTSTSVVPTDMMLQAPAAVQAPTTVQDSVTTGTDEMTSFGRSLLVKPEVKALGGTELFTQQLYTQLADSIPGTSDSAYLKNVASVEANDCKSAVKNILTLPSFVSKKSSYTDQQYVELLFRALASRDVDAQNLTNWTSSLSKGYINRDTIVDSLYSFTEIKDVCVARKLYQN